jgi:hypothetical protein
MAPQRSRVVAADTHRRFLPAGIFDYLVAASGAAGTGGADPMSRPECFGATPRNPGAVVLAAHSLSTVAAIVMLGELRHRKRYVHNDFRVVHGTRSGHMHNNLAYAQCCRLQHDVFGVVAARRRVVRVRRKSARAPKHPNPRQRCGAASPQFRAVFRISPCVANP